MNAFKSQLSRIAGLLACMLPSALLTIALSHGLLRFWNVAPSPLMLSGLCVAFVAIVLYLVFQQPIGDFHTDYRPRRRITLSHGSWFCQCTAAFFHFLYDDAFSGLGGGIAHGRPDHRPFPPPGHPAAPW